MDFSIRVIGEDNAMTSANVTTEFRGKWQMWFSSPLKSVLIQRALTDRTRYKGNALILAAVSSPQAFCALKFSMIKPHAQKRITIKCS